ncbi:MAG: hypothetical protein RL398_458 [Planctomycetota bacterium]
MPHSAPSTDLLARIRFATEAAVAAGARLAGLRASGKWADEMLGDIGDQAADGYLQGFVRGRYPDDALLSEETKDDPSRLGRRFAWIVDPLDGTKEYRTGRHDWAVHVGLAIDGRAAVGAVAMPTIDRVLVGCCVPGAEQLKLLGTGGDWPTEIARGGQAPGGRLRLAVSRSHTPDWVQRVADRMGGAELVPSGSVGVKVALLLLGKADAYVHKPGLKEWDTCAPAAIAEAAGWAVCRIDGSEQLYNQANPRNDEIVVCRSAQREQVLAALRECAPR